MTQDRELAEVLALLEKATPGEWRVYGRGNYGHGEEGSIETADGRDVEPAVSPAYDAPTIRGEVMLADAEAIAAAVNFLRKHGPALLSRTPAGEDARKLVARKHRGSLDDSMETAKSIPATEVALREFFDSPAGTLEVRPYGWDKRIGWDTHIVTIDGAAVGFTNATMAKERA